MSPLFGAVIEATEEAVYNSLFRATTVSGHGHTVEALPIEKTTEILRKYRVNKVKNRKLEDRLAHYRRIEISVIARKSGRQLAVAG
jgi:hypothetical protein